MLRSLWGLEMLRIMKDDGAFMLALTGAPAAGRGAGDGAGAAGIACGEAGAGQGEAAPGRGPVPGHRHARRYVSLPGSQTLYPMPLSYRMNMAYMTSS